MGALRRRRGSLMAGVVVLAGVLVAGVACSSSTLTAEQRTALAEVAAAYDQAEQGLANAFEADVVVPNLERWQETETLHQEALVALRDALPEGSCRASIEDLLKIEEGQNAIRLRLIENYRQEQYALVAQETTQYGISVVNGALQAEAAVPVACGRSSVDPAVTGGDPGSLTPEQNALFDAVLAAYAATREAFDGAFSVSEFVSDVENVGVAEAAVAKELDEVIAQLGDGPCKTSLVEVRAVEQQQADLREVIIEKGKAGDLVAMFTALGEYTAVNSTSEPFTTARQSAVDNCGAEV